jgi:hypothetical protein
VNWLLRQVNDAPDSIRLDVFALRARGATTSQLLGKARTDPAAMVDDPKREIRSFRLTMSAAMGSKRGQGRGSFVSSVLDLVDEFYRQVVEGVRPATTPPKLRPVQGSPTEVEPEAVPRALVSTALSSQDGAEAAPASLQSEPDPTLAPVSRAYEPARSGGPVDTPD